MHVAKSGPGMALPQEWNACASSKRAWGAGLTDFLNLKNISVRSKGNTCFLKRKISNWLYGQLWDNTATFFVFLWLLLASSGLQHSVLFFSSFVTLQRCKCTLLHKTTQCPHAAVASSPSLSDFILVCPVPLLSLLLSAKSLMLPV